MSKIEYRYGEYKDFVSMKNIWITCFNDTAKGFRLFCKNIDKYGRYYVASDKNMAVAALYHIPCTVDGQQCHYLYAAATLPEYRCRGIMANLVKFSLEDAAARGDKLSFLYPANPHLWKYYEKLGYITACKRKTVTLSREELMNIAEYGGFCVSLNMSGIFAVRNKVMKSNALIFPDLYMKFTISALKHYGGYAVTGSDGYALVAEDEYGKCTVSELACDPDYLNVLLGELLENTGADEFTLNYPACYTISDKETTADDGMLKYLSDYKLKEAYIGLRNQ